MTSVRLERWITRKFRLRPVQLVAELHDRRSILPDAIALLKKQRPAVAISVMVGTYDILMPSLLVGDLDMVLGRLPEEGRSRALVYEEFYVEPISIVTRRGHPLARKRRLGLR